MEFCLLFKGGESHGKKIVGFGVVEFHTAFRPESQPQHNQARAEFEICDGVLLVVTLTKTR